MKTGENKMVSLIYELRLNDSKGKIVEIIDKEEPLEFLFGGDELLEEFESKLVDKTVGDKFEFTLSVEEAYGEFNEDAIVEMPKDVFNVNGQFDEEILVVGNEVPMQDEDGNEYDGIILEISKDKVKIDFNHPLAGESLYFKGEIIAIREATEEDFEDFDEE